MIPTHNRWCGCGAEWTESCPDGIRRYQQCRTCQERYAEAFWKRICPPLYQDTDPARLPERPLAAANQWTFGSKGLLLIGETGLCKTRIAWLTLRRIFKERPALHRDFVFFDCVSFDHEITRRYRHDDHVIEWLDGLSQAPLLFFDDLGKIKFTERAAMELFALTERRTANRLPIIATTNDTGDSLAGRMSEGRDEHRGPALVRRLRDYCAVIQF